MVCRYSPAISPTEPNHFARLRCGSGFVPVLNCNSLGFDFMYQKQKRFRLAEGALWISMSMDERQASPSGLCTIIDFNCSASMVSCGMSMSVLCHFCPYEIFRTGLLTPFLASDILRASLLYTILTIDV